MKKRFKVTLAVSENATGSQEARRLCDLLTDALRSAGMTVERGDVTRAVSFADAVVHVHARGFTVTGAADSAGLERVGRICRQLFDGLHAVDGQAGEDEVARARRLSRLENRTRRMEQSLAEERAAHSRLRHENAILQAQIDAMEASLSWRLMRPLREAAQRARRFRAMAGRRMLKLVRGGLGRLFVPLSALARRLSRSERARHAVRLLLRPVPGLRTRLAAFARARLLSSGETNLSGVAGPMESEFTTLGPESRQVYQALQRAAGQQRKAR